MRVRHADGQVHNVTLATARARWPNFAPEALARGFGSILSVPLHARDRTIGALNLSMARQACTSEEAFDMLRRASQRFNRKLREIAEDIVSARDQRPSTVRNPPAGDTLEPARVQPRLTEDEE